MYEHNETAGGNPSTTTIVILYADFSHIVQKHDVWLVYTTKSNRPWVCVPNSVTYGDTTITATLSTNGGRNDD